jgi:myo-inositol-1(or 4)-monophosphatase
LDLPRAAAIAERAARAAGEVIRASTAGPDVRTKGAGDYVTETDLAAERAALDVLRAETPGVAVLSEEAGGEPAGGPTWAVDPLDGTTNFVHGFWAVAVSVALLEDGRPVAGCVHAPVLGETYVAVRGGGATRDGEPLRVSERVPGEAVVATGFPFRQKDRLLPRYLRTFEAALRTFEDLRRPGAAALDLAWTAAGVFDGFFELGLSTWDVAAGVLLIEEAGGHTSDWAGGSSHVAGGDILAGNPAVHAELLRLAAAARA